MGYGNLEETKSLSIELSSLPSSEVGGIEDRCSHISHFPYGFIMVLSFSDSSNQK